MDEWKRCWLTSSQAYDQTRNSVTLAAVVHQNPFIGALVFLRFSTQQLVIHELISERQKVREGKVLRVLLSGRWLPRNQG